MQTELVNIGLGFLEGFALIVSPCILPILPIILAGSLVGSKKRPFGIIAGFVIFFALITFFSRQVLQYSGIDSNLIRHIAYSILLLLGCIMLSTYLTEKFTQLTQRLASIGSALTSPNNSQGGFFSGLLFGGLVAIIWTPCAGPILAAVILQTVIQKTTLMSFLTLLAFGIGTAIPMLIITLFGRKILERFSFLKAYTSSFRKILGAIIIAGVVYMINMETNVSTTSTAVQTNHQPAIALKNGLLISFSAPSIGGISAWINSPPLQLSDLKGKVVLIDFWAYSCINCIRTLPYLKDWYDKYHDKGLVIIGVHTPEFDFEKDLNNVKSAVQKAGIKYPVALDNQFVTWQNFGNNYWPAHYLINKKGDIVYTHFGEGDYDITENNIRYLLGIKDTISYAEKYENNAYEPETPETYLGYTRAQRFSSPEAVVKDKVSLYSFPEKLSQDAWSLQGNWIVMPDKIISAQAGAAVKIHFRAQKVFIVMGSATQKPISVALLLNGEKVTDENGKDVVNSSVEVNKHTLYKVIRLSIYKEGTLQVIASAPGLEVYTFTFGE